MTSCDVLRISREIADIQKGTDLSIAVAHQDSDVRTISALIIGPPGTPYEYGFFEFSVKFGPQYPLKPPKVEAKTTNAGRCRFNPNIYAEGKVCLSILGTWPGEKGEEWSPAQGLESILVSIQSLMSSNPYENEPGFETATSPSDKEDSEAYCDKIRHETLRIAVIQRLENILGIRQDNSPCHKTSPEDNGPLDKTEYKRDEETTRKTNTNKPCEPLLDLTKHRFLWYFESYLQSIDDNASKNADGTAFTMMPFEHPSNRMNGAYQYQELKKRLLHIKKVIDQETDGWATTGLRELEDESCLAYRLRVQFKQAIPYYKQKGIHNIEISLCSDNPFVWIITYFGRSGSNLDGGVFRIRLAISPRFPDEQPRAKAETQMYHHRVSANGVICCLVRKTDEVKHHIDALILTLEDESPPYDPRAIVNPEASKLLWGDAGDKKLYARKQRRSAQDSVEM